jgi:TRAP-type mannitol/chloroaromatic compound transport system permease large subunit
MRVSLWPPKAAVAPPEDRAVRAVVVTEEAVATVVVTVVVLTGVVTGEAVMGVAVATEAAVDMGVGAATAVAALEAWVARAGQAAPQEAQAHRVMAVAVAWAVVSGVARDMEEATREAV